MKSFNEFLRRTAVLLAVALGASACGPISAFSNVRDADIEIEKAKAVGADKVAVYEFVSAQQYLAKAREEQGYADYQVAVDLAKTEVRLGQFDSARTRLSGVLPTLRKRKRDGAGLLPIAARALSDITRPVRRLRRKSLPEKVECRVES